MKALSNIGILSQIAVFMSPEPSPWIADEARKYLCRILKPSYEVFEWGAGGSTLFFARRVKKIVSIEHGKYWYIAVGLKLKKLGIANCELRCVSPESDCKIHDRQVVGSFHSKRDGFRSVCFQRYCEAINAFTDDFFDMVFIDGRARASCLDIAREKVKKGGCLVLDDSDRKEYLPAISLLKNWRRKSISGYKLGTGRNCQTTFFVRPA